jgi:hypothetical protein
MAQPNSLIGNTQHPGQLMNLTLLKCAVLFFFTATSWFVICNGDGNPYLFLLFNFSFLTMAALTLPKPRLYSYTFIAALLFLGFWMKVMMYLIFSTAFLEPIGAFDGSPQAWDRAISYALMAAFGACFARCVHLWLVRRHSWPVEVAVVPANPAPQWYIPLRTLLWTGSFALLLLLHAVNFQVAFYQTGVNPKLILPLHLNVVVAWLINVGFALWFACLIHWEFAHSPKNFPNTLIAPVVEGLLCSTSALSRSFYVMHTIPYYLALCECWTRVRGMLPWRSRAGLAVLWLLVLVLSLGIVSWFRIHIYYLGYVPTYFAIPGGHSQLRGGDITAGATLANQLRPMAQQVSNLFVARWTGLEGTLAVSAYEAKSPALLLEALRESPTLGIHSIYQKIAESPYQSSEAFTFLTLPGFVAILAYSDSLLVILIGSALLVLLVIGTEIAGTRLTRNPLLLSVACLAAANVLCQTNFPYLTAVFLVQLWVALAFVWGLQALPYRTLRSQIARKR